MPHAIPFGEVLEAADQLTPDEQQELAAILTRRVAEVARHRVAADIQEARGVCRRPLRPRHAG